MALHCWSSCPPVYGPTKEHVEELRKYAVSLGLDLDQLQQTTNGIYTLLDTLAENSRVNVGQLLPLAFPLNNPRIFRTRSHRDIVTIVRDGVSGLSKGNLRGVNGSCGWTIIGAKGIGKTTVQLALTDACTILFPGVVAVYVSFNEVDMPNAPFVELTLLGAVLQNLIDRNFLPKLPNPKPKIPPNELLAGALQKADLRLLIFVDEIDQLYRQHSETTVGKLGVQSLNELSYLGNQKSGRFLTYVCGSSGVIPILVSRNSLGDIAEEFPLVKNAPNLNGTKFRSQRAYSSIPTDLNVVSAILNQQDCPVEFRRVVTFVAGSTVRAIQTILLDNINSHLLESLAADETLQGWNTLKDAKHGPFLGKLIEKFESKNKALMESLLKDGTIDFGAVGTIDWENRFQPLSYIEAQQAFGEVQKEQEKQENTDDQVLRSLLHLHDRSWIVVTGVSNGAPDDIYPCSLAQVLKKTLDGPRLEAARKTVAEIIKDGIMKFPYPGCQ